MLTWIRGKKEATNILKAQINDLFPITTLQHAVQQVSCYNSTPGNVGSIMPADFFEKSIKQSKFQLNTQH